MAGLSNTFENSLMLLIFNNTDITNIGDAGGLRGSVSPGSLYVGLNTATLDDTSSQNTSEATYTPYARKDVARSGAGWTVTNNTADNTAAITFATCTSGSSTVTDFNVGRDSGTAAGLILFYGALGSSLAITTNITPQFAIGALDCTAD